MRRAGVGGMGSCKAADWEYKGRRLQPTAILSGSYGQLLHSRSLKRSAMSTLLPLVNSLRETLLPGGTGSPTGPRGGCLGEGGGSPWKRLPRSRRLHFKRVPVSPLCRNTHAHGSHYNPIMQQPALLASHVTLPAAQPVNVGVAHVMRQPPAATTSSRKSKQHQSAPR